MSQICWCCQELFPEGPGTARDRVWLDQDFCLPVCRACWERIPEAQRVELALKFRDRGPSCGNVADVLDWLHGVMANSELAGTLPPWFRNLGRDTN